MSSNFSETVKILPGPGRAATPDRSIGAMLIDSGKIVPQDGERILRYAKEKGIRFGDAAIALKLVTPDDIQQVLARQFDYPYLAPGESNVSRDVVAAWSPFSSQVEALRAVRSQLLLRWFTDDENRKSLALVSNTRGDGRSYLAANLAVVFSQMGEHTLLVDADLRNPKQHELFGISNAKGLSAVLSDRSGLDVIQRIPAFVDLSVMTAGAVPPNPLELLGRSAFGEMMRALSKEFDVIILDTPSAEDGSDFQLVTKHADGALMIARLNRARIAACERLAEEIDAAGTPLVGSILNEY